MGSTLDFISATMADAISPKLRRPVEDIIYETIDRKQIPTRTDFSELRNIVNSLRSQSTNSTRGISKLKDGLDEIEESIHDLQTQVVDLSSVVSQLQNENELLRSGTTPDLTEIIKRLDALENQTVTSRPVTSASGTPCRVDGCTSNARGFGFCSRHYAKWRRGTLPGYVSYEATVTVNGQTIQVDESLKGHPFSVVDENIVIGDLTIPV